MKSKLLEHIKKNEGFRAKPYWDKTGLGATTFTVKGGFLTVGYGTNLNAGITKEQAEVLVNLVVDSLIERFMPLPWFQHLSERRKLVCLEMAYQLGFNGFMRFVKMREALIEGDYDRAAAEIIDSRLPRNRAFDYAYRMRPPSDSNGNGGDSIVSSDGDSS